MYYEYVLLAAAQDITGQRAGEFRYFKQIAAIGGNSNAIFRLSFFFCLWF